MLDDFRQEKQDQQLDPLSEGSSLPWSKKIGLLCLAIALIGLFIFFTSDTWSSDSKNSKGKDELAQEVEQLKIRVSDLEQRLPTRTITTTAMTMGTDTQDSESESSTNAPAMANLKSLIEQELQETASVSMDAGHDLQAKAETPSTSQPQAKKQTSKPEIKQATYTVKKGDTLSKIAQQFYGSPKKWRRIVEANKDKLGQSQMLKAGMTLAIPKDS
jgi:nucleoid-associated protein YgaU